MSSPRSETHFLVLPPPKLRRATSLDALATAGAPPFFIWHTAEDPYVPVEHSYRLAAALAAQRVPHALHVFSKGPHSLGLARGAGEASAWTDLAAAWLIARLELLARRVGDQLPAHDRPAG